MVKGLSMLDESINALYRGLDSISRFRRRICSKICASHFLLNPSNRTFSSSFEKALSNSVNKSACESSKYGEILAISP